MDGGESAPGRYEQEIKRKNLSLTYLSFSLYTANLASARASHDFRTLRLCSLPRVTPPPPPPLLRIYLSIQRLVHDGGGGGVVCTLQRIPHTPRPS